MNSFPPNITFEKWIQTLFDHPEASSDYSFWWDEGYDPPMWNEMQDQEKSIELLTRLFTSPGFLLEQYTPHQVNAGLYYIVSPGCSCYMHCLLDENIEWKKRRLAIQSMIGLYRDLWAPLYGNNLIASSDTVGGAGKPQTACYMWWDIIAIWPGDHVSNPVEITDAIFNIFEEGLNLTSEACLESLLHGIGHYHIFSPARANALIDRLLQRSELSKDLRDYAECARHGCIQ